MSKMTNKQAFEAFSKGEIGSLCAVRNSHFKDYSTFLDAYFAAGYSYPIPDQEQLDHDVAVIKNIFAAMKKKPTPKM